MKQLLSISTLFDVYQSLIGVAHLHRYFAQTWLCPSEGARVLDLGCGTGALRAYLPDSISYTGVDLSEKYLSKARKLWSHKSDSQFYHGDAAQVQKLELEPVDFVIVNGFMHHLSDEKNREVFEAIPQLLKPSGSLVGWEPCLTTAGSRLSRFMIRHDRGEFIRTEQAYRNLLSSFFQSITSEFKTNVLRLRYPILFLKASKHL